MAALCVRSSKLVNTMVHMIIRIAWISDTEIVSHLMY